MIARRKAFKVPSELSTLLFLQEKNPNFYKQTGISLEKTKNLAYIRKVVKNEMYVTWVGRKLMA